MLSKEDNRRLAQLERQLRREDPGFCARMQPGRPEPRRVPLSVVLTAAVIWAAALLLGVLGWWLAAAIAAVWALLIVVALAVRQRRGRHDAGPGLPPPAW
jgi:Flp pilus assembly protein TadB